MKVVWAENVIGRNRFGMKVSWMKLSSLLDGLGRQCFWMNMFLDEFFLQFG